jgi:hypothetical protein
MLAPDELLARAREYRESIAPEDLVDNILSYEEEVRHVQIKFRIVDRLAKDCGSSLDDRQLFSVSVTNAINTVSVRLNKDGLLEAIFDDLAANVELACRSPISDVQLSQLSRIMNRAAGLYYKRKYFVHAMACYTQAQRGFRKTGAFEEEREAEYSARVSLWRARTSLSSLITGFWSNLLFGFGFRPYRVLWAVLVIIVLFGAAYWRLAATHDVNAALFMSGYAYFGMLGKGDLVGESAAFRVLTVFESFLSVVVNSTLVALLAKRWFRF